MIDETLTKRQHEILERLEQSMPVKKIATDLGVSRNAVYLQIERLRDRGVLPREFTPSGQPPRTQSPVPMPGLELGAAVPAPGFGPGSLTAMRSELAELRRPATRDPARRASSPGRSRRPRPGTTLWRLPTSLAAWTRPRRKSSPRAS